MSQGRKQPPNQFDRQANQLFSSLPEPIQGVFRPGGPLGGPPEAQDYGGLKGQIEGLAPLDFSGLPALDYGTEAGQKAYDTAYNDSTRRLTPEFGQREDALRTRLLNQGLDPNSEAARGAMAQLAQERTDAFTGARARAFGEGQQAQGQAFGQSLAARGQGLAELIRGRDERYRNVGALQGILGQQDAGDLSRYGLQQQFWGDLLGGAGQAGSQVASSLLPLLLAGSDARIKRLIRRLPTMLLPGVPLATWEYRTMPGRRWLGIIAQDLARVAPSLVFRDTSGILRVPFIPIEVSHAA